MPWKETCAIDQKIQMIGDYLSQVYTITQLSEMYEVSRKTIYKWIGRYRVAGHHPGKQWPASSPAGDILKWEGLVRSRRKKGRTPPYTQPFNEGNRANAVWRADFKGQFRTGDGKFCYPLTISDNYRRYLLSCPGLR